MSAGQQGRHGETHDLFFAVEDVFDLADQALEKVDGWQHVRDGCRIGQVLLRSGFSEAFSRRKKYNTHAEKKVLFGRWYSVDTTLGLR